MGNDNGHGFKLLRKKWIFSPLIHGCGPFFLNCRESPSPPAKESETRSELHKTTLKHMFLAWMRGFFPPEFVQESDLLSCFQGLDMVNVWRAWSRFPSPGVDGYRGRGSHFSGNDSTRVCVCPISVGSCHPEGPELEEYVLCSRLFLILRLFPAIFSWLSWVRQEHPKYVSGIQSLVLLFGAFFQLNSLGNHIRLLTQNEQVLLKFLQKNGPFCLVVWVEFVLIKPEKICYLYFFSRKFSLLENSLSLISQQVLSLSCQRKSTCYDFTNWGIVWRSTCFSLSQKPLLL